MTRARPAGSPPDSIHQLTGDHEENSKKDLPRKAYASPGPSEDSGDHTRAYERGGPFWDRRHAEFLIEAGRRLSASLNTRRCARATAELATSLLADFAMVVLPHGPRPAFWLRAWAGRVEEGTIPAAATAEVSGLADALAGFPTAPSSRLDPGRIPCWVLPDGFGEVGHVLVTPLPGNEGPAGALLLVRGQGAPPFDEETEILVRVFAARAGAAVAAAVLYQEQSAVNRVLTEGLLPPRLPEIDQVELAGSLHASQHAGLIGGDFYDVYLPGGGGTDTAGHAPLVILGDVCGKGARAAVLAGQIRHSMRTLLLLEDDPERLVELLNRSLLASPAPDSYATLVLAAVRPDPGDGHVEVDLSVAGHPEPLILRADGRVEVVTARGTMLGALPRIDLTSVTVRLAPGELCLLYSDGITEALGGPTREERYELERLRSALATCAGMPAAAVVQRLEQITTEWIARGDQDDRALLAIQARPRGGRAT
ncbi:PP2C family protein-serine/threonine phosphatase [Sphaerisporangium fuscum]|uniref:PP2C family protein-serine/threonine phosphatase n=1 Tax=Sphaerisporangium fuscum TaxID=2835868 RepID=UPI001BDD7E5A|nr:PP2C family protein-serine/threonine phosphatase [Sphaerisporangium fuscum]